MKFEGRISQAIGSAEWTADLAAEVDAVSSPDANPEDGGEVLFEFAIGPYHKIGLVIPVVVLAKLATRHFAGLEI